MKWISVKERLPEENENIINYYLACFKDKEVFEVFFNKGKFWFRGDCCRDDADISFDNITHWMPLPPPPEESWQDIASE